MRHASGRGQRPRLSARRRPSRGSPASSARTPGPPSSASTAPLQAHSDSRTTLGAPPGVETSWLRLRPAASPEATLNARTRLRLPRPISLPRLLGRAGRPCRPCFCHDRRLQLCTELGEDDAVLATPPEVGSVRLASQRRGSAQCRGGQGAASAARPCHLGGERCHGNCTPKKQRTRQVARGFCLFGPSVEALSWPGTPHEGTWSGPGWHHHGWHDLSEAWEVPIRVACSTAARRLPVLSRPGRSTTVIILNGVRTTRSLKSSTPARKGGVSGFTQ